LLKQYKGIDDFVQMKYLWQYVPSTVKKEVDFLSVNLWQGMQSIKIKSPLTEISETESFKHSGSSQSSSSG